MSIFSIDSLLLAQIDTAGQTYPAFNSSLFGEILIVDENLTDNRTNKNDFWIEIANLTGDAPYISKCDEQPIGVYQVMVYTLQDKGKGNIQKLCDEIKSGIDRVVSDPNNLNPDLNVSSVNIRKFGVDGKFYRYDIDINYFSFN